MALNINQNGNVNSRQVSTKSQTSAQNTQQTQAGQPTVSRTTTGAVLQDSVSLTQQAQDLSKMQSSLSSTSSFNQDRVGALKKAISEGKYSVDPEKLAQNMLSFEDELKSILG